MMTNACRAKLGLALENSESSFTVAGTLRQLRRVWPNHGKEKSFANSESHHDTR